MHRISTSRRPMRWTSLFSLLAMVSLAFWLAACGGSSTTAPTAQKLLTDAQAALNKASSYHFNLKVDNPGTSGLLTIQSADGDLVVPDKLKANANALVLGNVVQVQFISIGAKEYVTDPITQKWTPASGLLDARSLSDPQTGVSALLGHLENPSAPTDANVNGTDCWSTTGKLDPKYLAGILGSHATSSGKLDVVACIGKADNLPYQIRLTGIAVEGDTAKTVRTFLLSKYNESVTITAPIV